MESFWRDNSLIPSDNKVIDHSKPHPTSFRLSMLLALLGVCVFVWGLGYKLSLYETPSSSIHRIPEAKLLCRSEDRNAADGVSLFHAKSPALQQAHVYTFVLAVVLVSLMGISANPGRRFTFLPKPWCLRLGAFQSEFFLRPPPVYISL